MLNRGTAPPSIFTIYLPNYNEFYSRSYISSDMQKLQLWVPQRVDSPDRGGRSVPCALRLLPPCQWPVQDPQGLLQEQPQVPRLHWHWGHEQGGLIQSCGQISNLSFLSTTDDFRPRIRTVRCDLIRMKIKLPSSKIHQTAFAGRMLVYNSKMLLRNFSELESISSRM